MTIDKFKWNDVVYYLHEAIEVDDNLDDSEIADIVIPLSFKAMHVSVAE